MTPFMSQLEPCSIHPRAMLSIHLRAKAKLSDAKQSSLSLSLSALFSQMSRHKTQRASSLGRVADSGR